MYKVFFNDHSLAFCDKSKSLPKHNKVQIIDAEQFNCVLQELLDSEVAELTENLVVACTDTTAVWDNFKEKLNKAIRDV